METMFQEMDEMLSAMLKLAGNAQTLLQEFLMSALKYVEMAWQS
jgi:hypothetical protein